MLVLLGFLVMVALLLAQLFFDVDYDPAYRRCPRCGTRSIRVARIWEMRDHQPWCRTCGARFRYRDGDLIPV